MGLCCRYFGLFLGSDKGPRGSICVRMGEMDLGGRMGAGKNFGFCNITLIIQSRATENSAVFRLHLVASGL